MSPTAPAPSHPLKPDSVKAAAAAAKCSKSTTICWASGASRARIIGSRLDAVVSLTERFANRVLGPVRVCALIETLPCPAQLCELGGKGLFTAIAVPTQAGLGFRCERKTADFWGGIFAHCRGGGVPTEKITRRHNYCSCEKIY